MAASRVTIRMWRLVRPERGPGLFVWFDPECEAVELFELDPSTESRVLALTRGDEPDWFGEAPSSNDELDTLELLF